MRAPDIADEAMRDLVRSRDDTVREQRNARHRLKALLLRNGIGYSGRTSWTPAHVRWLASLKLPQPAQQIGFQEYLHSINESTARPRASPSSSRPCAICCPPGRSRRSSRRCRRCAECS